MNNDITSAIIRLRASVIPEYDYSYDKDLIERYLRDKKYRNVFLSNDFNRETYAKYILHEKHYSNSEVVQCVLNNDLSELKGFKSLNRDIILSIFSSHYYPNTINSREEIIKYFNCIDNIMSFNFK